MVPDAEFSSPASLPNQNTHPVCSGLDFQDFYAVHELAPLPRQECYFDVSSAQSLKLCLLMIHR